VAPASNQYVIGRPFVQRAVMHLPNGKTFTVVAEHLDKAHPYIGRVTLDGQPLDRTWIGYRQIMAGGTLRFVMRATPDKQWATTAAARPYAMSAWMPAAAGR
ncbi:MAG TPA: glycoside hydrolase domain-containing protein, partial [Nevskiaceae bacterium]|nr:glycoside hydrolase domain-containing protein [Nevskiaceae bacterium]